MHETSAQYAIACATNLVEAAQALIEKFLPRTDRSALVDRTLETMSGIHVTTNGSEIAFQNSASTILRTDVSVLIAGSIEDANLIEIAGVPAKVTTSRSGRPLP